MKKPRRIEPECTDEKCNNPEAPAHTMINISPVSKLSLNIFSSSCSDDDEDESEEIEDPLAFKYPLPPKKLIDEIPMSKHSA